MNLQEEVTHFLSQVREVLSKEGGKNFRQINRKKNRDDLADLNITPYQLREIIYNLTYKNYCNESSVKDSSSSRKLYVFGADFDESEMYIKLELIVSEEIIICNCISFHIAEFPIEYPLKGGEEK